jgi:hypothetical protein
VTRNNRSIQIAIFWITDPRSTVAMFWFYR